MIIEKEVSWGYKSGILEPFPEFDANAVNVHFIKELNAELLVKSVAVERN